MFRCRRCGCPIYGKGTEKCPNCDEFPLLEKNELTDISPRDWQKINRLDQVVISKKKEKEDKK